MSLNSNMANMLSAIVAACRVPPNYSLQNVKGPLVRALEKDGFISRVGGITDPSNADRAGFIATDRGYAEVGTTASAEAIAVVASNPGQPSPAQPPTIQLTPPGQAAAPAPSTTGNPTLTNPAPAAPKAPRAPRVEPVVHHSGARFSALPMAPTRTRAGGKSAYRFSQLAVPDATGYDSFFVEATAEMPEPFKKVRATVTGANKRFESEGKKFSAIEVADDMEFHKAGVRVFRIT